MIGCIAEVKPSKQIAFEKNRWSFQRGKYWWSVLDGHLYRLVWRKLADGSFIAPSDNPTESDWIHSCEDSLCGNYKDPAH